VAWLERQDKGNRWRLARLTVAADAIREPVWINSNQILVVAFRPDATDQSGANYLRIINTDGSDGEEILLTQPTVPKYEAANNQLQIRIVKAGAGRVCVYDGLTDTAEFFELARSAAGTHVVAQSRRPLPPPPGALAGKRPVLAVEADAHDRVTIVRNAEVAPRRHSAVITTYSKGQEPRSVTIGIPWNAAYFARGEVNGIRPGDPVLIESVVTK